MGYCIVHTLILISLCAWPSLAGAQTPAVDKLAPLTIALPLGDAASTLKGLRQGAREANPLMGGLTRHPGALIALKGVQGVGMTWLLHQGAKAHPRLAFWTAVGLNAGQAMIIWHNLKVIRRH